MIFLVTGTMNIPFDRLVKLVDKAIEAGIINETVFGQIGDSTYVPKNYEYERYLDKNEFDTKVKNASLILCHSGMGIILQAQENAKPIIIFPRYKKYNEHVNNHQIQTAKSFENRSFLEVVFDREDFKKKYEEMKKKVFNNDDFYSNNSIESISDEINSYINSYRYRKPNIIAGASSGGHLTQLLKILDSNTTLKKISTILTTLELQRDNLEKDEKTVYTLGECNRNNIRKIISVIKKIIFIKRQVKPDIIISTGALPLALFSFLSFWSGTKIIWIDSIANINKISMSGRFIKPFTSLFITQWPELENTRKKIYYRGSVF